MAKILVLFVFLFSTIGSIYGDDIEKLKKLHKNHEVRSAKTWEGWKEKPLSKRITTAPKNIIEFIGLDNKIYGYEGVPKKAEQNSTFRKEFLEVLDELPLIVKEQMKKDLIGVFFVTDLGSTGFTEYVYKDGKYYGGFILFDQNILSKLKANEWATWRVNTAFKKQKDYELSLKIADKNKNNTKGAIQFILLHEIGHILALSKNAHPKSEKDDPKKYQYSSISWNSIKESKFDREFKTRKDFNLYRFDRATVSLERSKDMIKELEKTDFCSLYGSNSFFEDFAECYTIYVHSVLMNKPYELSLKYKDKEIVSFKDPFSKNNLKRKKRYFNSF